MIAHIYCYYDGLFKEPIEDVRCSMPHPYYPFQTLEVYTNRQGYARISVTGLSYFGTLTVEPEGLDPQSEMVKLHLLYPEHSFKFYWNKEGDPEREFDPFRWFFEWIEKTLDWRLIAVGVLVLFGLAILVFGVSRISIPKLEAEA